MAELVGLIPAAGRGVRAYPYTATIPKSMLEVDGIPLIQRNVELLRDALGIRDVHIVVGHQGHVIRQHLRDGSRFGVRINYLQNDRLELELPYSVYLGAQAIRSHCCMILADECYVGTNHRDLLATAWDTPLATLTFIASDTPKHIRKNYIGTFVDGRVTALVEKPRTATAGLMGTGTYLLHPALLERLTAAYGGGIEHGPRDWTGFLDHCCRTGDDVRPFVLTGRYVNVNSRDDLNRANYLIRDRSFESRSTSLVYVLDHPHAEAIRPLAGFAEEPAIDEIVVAARRPLPPDGPALPAKARVVVTEGPDAGAGDLVRLGLGHARGDIFVLAYSDDTFVPRDIAKLLVYLRDADMVVGSRTTRQMIEQGTNMRGLVRWVHLVLAKLVEMLWWRFDCRFTDVCCVYRAFWRSTWDTVSERLTASGPEIFPEQIVEVLRARKRIIEVPVNYYNREPGTPYVRSRYQSPAMLARILLLLTRKRLGGWFEPRRADALHGPAQAAEHRRAERDWQDRVGHDLLDVPHGFKGAAAVFHEQFDRIADELRDLPPGCILEIGCGKGHLLRHLRDKPWLAGHHLAGLDLSRAVHALPAAGIAGVRGDGEQLPFRDGSVAAIVYDGALHHLIDYPAALRDAMRVLAPGGRLVLFEPVSSRFSQLLHRLLDPIIFRKTEYESPIDQLYKGRFREELVHDVVAEGLLVRTRHRSDFLAYPFTGCYAGSVFARSEGFMRHAIRLEALVWRAPGLRRVASALAWRFMLVAVKQAGPA